jgi:hypothetical protein
MELMFCWFSLAKPGCNDAAYCAAFIAVLIAAVLPTLL